MHPVLFHLGDFPISTYGALLAAGFVAGSALAAGLAGRINTSPVRLVELCCWLALGGSLGSRAFFAFQNWDAVVARPALAIELWNGGAVWYGGLIGGVLALAGYWATTRRQLGASLWDLGDVVIPAVSLSHLFGRLGCFSAGCCWGRHAELPWAVTFPEGSRCGVPGVPLHPTQLYEAGGELVVLAVLLGVWQKRRFSGQVFLTYFMAYPVLRLLVEPFRGDPIRGLIAETPFSIAQALSVALALCALAVYRHRRSSDISAREPL